MLKRLWYETHEEVFVPMKKKSAVEMYYTGMTKENRDKLRRRYQTLTLENFALFPVFAKIAMPISNEYLVPTMSPIAFNAMMTIELTLWNDVHALPDEIKTLICSFILVPCPLCGELRNLEYGPQLAIHLVCKKFDGLACKDCLSHWNEFLFLKLYNTVARTKKYQNNGKGKFVGNSKYQTQLWESHGINSHNLWVSGYETMEPEVLMICKSIEAPFKTVGGFYVENGEVKYKWC